MNHRFFLRLLAMPLAVLMVGCETEKSLEECCEKERYYETNTPEEDFGPSPLDP